jgi:hypothetical protein
VVVVWFVIGAKHGQDVACDSADRGTILFAARPIEAEPSLLGASTHLLIVTRRPHN